MGSDKLEFGSGEFRRARAAVNRRLEEGKERMNWRDKSKLLREMYGNKRRCEQEKIEKIAVKERKIVADKRKVEQQQRVEEGKVERRKELSSRWRWQWRYC